jgi:predicted O-methyltransferase YrrM
MNTVLAELLATGQVKTPQGEPRSLHSHLPLLEGELLQMWLVAYAPVRLVEIGLAYGVSSLFISEALANRSGIQYHIIDPHQSTQWENVGKTNLDRAGFSGRYILHQELSELCLPRMLAQGLAFDFAFLDGFHTFDHALVDFFTLTV